MPKLAVKVIPRAQSNEILGWTGERLRVKVAAAPEKGRANAALEAFLAERLGLPRKAVRVVVGHTAALKVVEVDGIEPDALAKLLPAAKPRR